MKRGIAFLLCLTASAFSQTPIPSPTPTLEERKAAMMEKFRAQQAARLAAQQPTQSNAVSITLDASSGATGNHQNDTWKTDYGSYERDLYSRRTVNCSVSVFGQVKPIQLVCFFFGDKAADALLDCGSVSVTFKDSRKGVAQFECRSKMHVLHLEAIGEHHEQGYTIKSWVVQAYDGEKLIAWRSSDNAGSLESFARESRLDILKRFNEESK